MIRYRPEISKQSLCFGLVRIISLDQLLYYSIGAYITYSTHAAIYAPLAQMAPFAIMLLILLIKPTGLYGSKLLKRQLRFSGIRPTGDKRFSRQGLLFCPLN